MFIQIGTSLLCGATLYDYIYIQNNTYRFCLVEIHAKFENYNHQKHPFHHFHPHVEISSNYGDLVPIIGETTLLFISSAVHAQRINKS